jgi:CRISPR-associated Csx2 family protein
MQQSFKVTLMKKILISQIGKPRGKFGEYELTTFSLDGKKFETSMISLGLINELQPDEIAFLGTTGSAWDALLGMANLVEPDMELMYRLEQLEEQDKKSDDLTNALAALAKCLSTHYQRPVNCSIIPYMDGENTQQQTAEYIQTIQALAPPGSSVILDVTHGLRYHPMLALLAAVYITTTKNVHIESILYGALERQSKDKVAPVIRLDSMLTVIQWISALNSFDKDGDYSVFVELMRTDGVSNMLLNEVEQAAFFERVSNSVQAKEKLRQLNSCQFDETTPLTHLFAEQIKQRIEWISVPGRGNSEFRLAREYLKRKDFIRAAIYAQEGYISKNLEINHGDVNDYQARDEFSKSDKVADGFRQLKKIRNALAHGLAAGPSKTRKILSSATDLEQALGKLIKQLEGG